MRRKYTPGPWPIECTSKGLDDWLVGPCSVTGKANAQLVSAVPELLESAEALIEGLLKPASDVYRIITALQNAVLKARGEKI